jgi:hypothetical protein
MSTNQQDFASQSDFVSYSPESSSSADTNLVSPPQHYHSVDYADMMWSDAHQGHVKRSHSVPPVFHKPRYPFMQQVKPLPIQIQKLAKEPISSQKPVDPETYRRQLDDKLAKINFDDITVAELKETLRERGLSATGRKAELMTRLKDEYDLVIHQNNSHVMLNRRLANMSLDQKKSPKISYAPYYTPPLRHSSIALAQLGSPQMNSSRLASSVPTTQTNYLNDQFMNFKPRENLKDTYIKEESSEAIKGN